MNVIPMPMEPTRRRLLDKIIAGQPLNPVEKAWLRWAATQPLGYPQPQPMENRNREPAA